MKNAKSQDQRFKFQVLDDLRTVAAICVVVYHYQLYIGNILPSAYLSVDLFFCLSGVVIAHSYGEQLQFPNYIKRFVYLRLIRLYPLFIISVVIQGSLLLLSAIRGSGTFAEAFKQLAPAIFFLPSPFHTSLYPINGPAWSLIFEILVNIFAGLLWRNLSDRDISLVMAISAFSLSVCAYDYGTIDGGYQWTGVGLAASRVSYSFFAGIMIYRYRSCFVSTNINGILPILTFLYVVSQKNNILTDLFIVIIMFPLLTLIAINSTSFISKISSDLGKLSYPLYVLHIPIQMILLNVVVHLGHAMTPLAAIISVALTVLISWVADKFYDHPVRRYITSRLKTRAPLDAVA